MPIDFRKVLQDTKNFSQSLFNPSPDAPQSSASNDTDLNANNPLSRVSLFMHALFRAKETLTDDTSAVSQFFRPANWKESYEKIGTLPGFKQARQIGGLLKPDYSGLTEEERKTQEAIDMAMNFSPAGLAARTAKVAKKVASKISSEGIKKVKNYVDELFETLPRSEIPNFEERIMMDDNVSIPYSFKNVKKPTPSTNSMKKK